MRTPARPTTATEHHGAVVDDAVELFEGVYSSHDINIGRAVEDGFTYRYRAVGDDEVLIATSAVAAHRWGRINPGRQYVLAWATGPGMVLDPDRRDPIRMQPHVPVMYPAGREFRFDAAPAVQHVIRFDGAFLESLGAAVRADLPGPLDMRSTADPAALPPLRRTIASAATTLWDPSADAAARSLQQRRVAQAVLEAFDVTPPSGLAAAGRGSVRVAQEWIAANAHRPLTTADVCRATGLSARGLQAAFHRAGASSPMQFLRDVRLHRVRAALTEGDPASTTVAEVARTWGFAHLGRFAGTYAAAFGERPSATLQRPAERWRGQRPSSAPTASTTT
ncbi:helix-turn-helix domain-containing protein [Curtobacterium caseinilyticum]|uniref:Helix-turn-helix domain-containing protein n=1 Tax=Curtobacterium caseinilyticum TaxID=3055137 RepID=A0ABT7TQX9_9MICO|nr:helix-turn-helix domain-containing protein [Curtobacterium caseinilyticum]MDM7891239.1 helix-turn-helix domain-containing protein [Curtobacterium caseinilyticum]